MFNKVILIGNLTRDVELRYLPSGQALAKCGIATNRRFKDASGMQKDETMFIDITVWGRSAEVANQYLRKGSRVLVEGRLTPEQFVALTSTNAAKIFGLYPRKGTLAPGADADIVVWDPDLKVTYGVAVAQHRTDYNLYEGWELTGFPVQVYLRGQLIVREGQWLGKRGQGRLLKRQPQRR